MHGVRRVRLATTVAIVLGSVGTLRAGQALTDVFDFVGHQPIAGLPSGPYHAWSDEQKGEARKLIVGREISLSGEINSCDRLIVEGSVEANLQNCHEVDIAESGLFKGSATIDEAEVRGRFEGNLVVRKRLLIRATGRVSGTIRYGQIEVECGGQISGEVQAQPIDEITSDASARVAF